MTIEFCWNCSKSVWMLIKVKVYDEEIHEWVDEYFCFSCIRDWNIEELVIE